MAVAAALACLALRGRTRRALGAIALAGLWFIAEPLFVIVTGIIVLGAFFWMLGRLLSGKKLLLAVALLVMGGGFLLLIALVAAITPKFAASRHDDSMAPSAPAPADAPTEMSEQAASAGAAKDNAPSGTRGKLEGYNRRGNFMAQDAAGGVLEGVTPVALTLPQYERSVYATRELVTRERPFQPVLFYATAWAAWPLGAGWLLAVAALLRIYRPVLLAASARLRERMTRASAVTSAGSPPDAPPAS
jgi:hypothetical protein